MYISCVPADMLLFSLRCRQARRVASTVRASLYQKLTTVTTFVSSYEVNTSSSEKLPVNSGYLQCVVQKGARHIELH